MSSSDFPIDIPIDVPIDIDEAQTATQIDASAGGEDRRSFRLVATSGKLKGTTFAVADDGPARVLIGKSEACDIRLDDPEISRRHAALERVGNDLRIEDLSSTNGTYVDQVKIRIADLRGGELVRVGAVTLRVDAHSPGPRASAGESDPASARAAFGRVIGASREMRRLYPYCERLAASNVPVIIEGETGTGKEALAESLHELGPRAAGPFVVFDCTAVPASLVESELFGHERGAFTGAATARAGVFEQARGGTLFIDEVGDFDLTLQPKLLRAIERNEVRRLGGDKWIHVDVRILSATRRNLDREVEQGRFRDDLFHRLAVTRIELPPLRHRLGDVALLAVQFWHALGGASSGPPPALVRAWAEHTWPGNVRELRNTVARHVALGDLAEDSPRAATAKPASTASADPIERVIASGMSFTAAREAILEELEQRYIARIIERHGGNATEAAAAAGIGERYLRKLRARRR